MTGSTGLPGPAGAPPSYTLRQMAVGTTDWIPFDASLIGVDFTCAVDDNTFVSLEALVSNPTSRSVGLTMLPADYQTVPAGGQAYGFEVNEFSIGSMAFSLIITTQDLTLARLDIIVQAIGGSCQYFYQRTLSAGNTAAA